jgi:hypothetical protein
MRTAGGVVRDRSVILLIGGTAGLALGLGLLLAPQAGCNDGSTGCCIVCMGSCPCGDSCVACGPVCTKLKGCACGSERSSLEARDAVGGVDAIMSVSTDR